jgi:hypothetical protein
MRVVLPRPARRLTSLLLALGAAAAVACDDERERLDVPRVRFELEDTVVAPGDSVRGRIHGGDTHGGIVRLAVRICIDSGFLTARLNYDRADTANFRFLLPVPASTPENMLVIVEGQVNDDQDFFVTTQDTIVARSPGVAPGPPPRQPSCARPGFPSQ